MTESKKPPLSRNARIGFAVGIVVAAVLAGWLLFHKSIEWSSWIAGAENSKELRRKLVGEPDPALIDKLEAALADDDRSRGARVTAGQILIEKNRLSLVERAAESSSFDVRTIALEALASQPFFRKQYADDPRFDFRATLLQWLKDGSRGDRVRAVLVLPQVVPYTDAPPDDILAALRALATLSTASAELRYMAAMSLAGYRDCATLEPIYAMAMAEEDAEAKHRELQAVAQLFENGGEDCRKRLSVEQLRALVARMLAHPGDGDKNRAVRMAALLVVERHPDWVDLESIRKALASATHEVERRSALEALIALGDAPTFARIPAYFHDESGGMRSAASSTIRKHQRDARLGIAPGAATALLVGYVSSEADVRGYQAPLRLAYSDIRTKAGVWVGLPEPFRTKGGSIGEVANVFNQLLSTGSFEGVTRAKFAEELFLWLAGDMKLSPEDAAKALKARNDFWAKALAGDTAGAKKVYEDAVGATPDLFAYERGWLQSKGAV